MADAKSQQECEDPNKPWKIAISAFVSVTHIIAFFQIVICSRHLAVAFDIPPKNIGIYFAKMYSLRSLLMSMGCGVEYGIFRATSMDVRKYLSMSWFVMLTTCEVSFLLVLYFSKRVAFHNYIVLNLEGMFFGFFQMSILSLIPEFASYYMLSLYVSGTCIFIIQTIIDKCTKNSMLSVKIQSWICVLCSVICVPLWIFYLIKLYKDPTEQISNKNGVSQVCSQTQPQPQVQQLCAGNGRNEGSSGSQTSSPTGGGSMSKQIQCLISLICIILSPVLSFFKSSNNGQTQNGRARRSLPNTYLSSVPKQTNHLKIQYLMAMTSLTILKIITDELSSLFSQLGSEQVDNIRILITRLNQITRESEITYEVLVAIDLVILGLKRSSYVPDKLTLLEELSLFLRIKSKIKPAEENKVFGSKSTAPEGTLKRRRRREASSSNSGGQTCKPFYEHLWKSLSPLMMFGSGSLVKDFLFPGVIPYGLLERDKCHLINLIVIIFLSIGPLTIFLINENSKLLKNNIEPYHYFWIFMAPKILILIISLCAIHTKQGCTHKIRSSQGIVLFMTVVLLTCYGFLETLSFVGMAFYVKLISNEPSCTVDLQALQNVSGKFFRYFVYKISVGYNKTRISSGFVLPNFKPPEPIPNTFCFWFKGAFSNGWKDIKGDFKMGIKQYLAVSQTVSKKSPLESLRYCDLLM